MHYNTTPVGKPERFPSNVVKTSKYNVATFLPRFLFEQFSQVAYFYFLIQVSYPQFPIPVPYTLFQRRHLSTALPIRAVLASRLLLLPYPGRAPCSES